MSLVLVGLNHETAPLPVRERVAYSRDEAVSALQELKPLVPQALLLSTCNRTELYALLADPADLPRVKERLFFRKFQGNGSDNYLYERSNEDVVRHLFRVACGLDSMVLGEQEILGQVKHAYEISRQAETVGTLFHRLAEQAVHVGKRARTETQIGFGPVSVAFAAVELAEKIFQKLEGRGVLLVGAGENGALCAQHLQARKAEPFLIANRTPERAEILARDLGGETIAWEGLASALTRVDIVVATTAAPHAIIQPEMVRDAMRKREGKPLLLVDLAVPRDIDPEVDRIQSVFRFDLDALKGVVDTSVTRRRKEVPAVEHLVTDEVEGFMRWWDSLASGPVIRDLHQAFESVRVHELEQNAKRFKDEDRAQLEVFSRNLVRKLLMSASIELKEQKDGDPAALERLATVRRIFRLDAKDEQDEGDPPSV
jgi:glutamyl-tRNA reductase